MGREDTTRMGTCYRSSTSWQAFGQVPVVSRTRTPQAARKEEAAHRRPLQRDLECHPVPIHP
jgi:hypothetical protein